MSPLETSRGGRRHGAKLSVEGRDTESSKRRPSASGVAAPAGATDGDLAVLLSGAVAEGVTMFAISAAAVIAVFGQSKPVERLGYFLAALVVVPLSVTLAWRRQRAGSGGGRRQTLAAATLAATAGVLCLVRLLATPTTGAIGTSLLLVVALVAARAAVALAGRLVPAAWLRRAAKGALVAMPVLLAAAAAPFVPPPTRSLPDVAVALAAGLAAFYLVRAHGARRDLPRAWTRALDVAVLAACTLVVVYLGRPTYGLVINHDYFLGPTLDVLHGHPMLVNTFSQYGVGMFDALAALFLVVPMGYGTFTLLLSGLTALLFAVLYTVLRWSAGSLLLAAAGVTVAVTLNVFGQINFYADYPSTGVLRFGLPWLVILCSLAAVRTPRRRRLFDALVLATVAVAAVWSGEAGVYCLGTAVALACLDAAVAQAGARERLLRGARGVGRLVAASVCGVLAFTVVTRVAAGAWADWGGYLEYIHLYTLGGFGDLPIEPWSPGLALGGMYAVSAIALVLLVAVRPELVRDRAVAFRAATGLTALGALVYTYFLGRAAENNLLHISPPAVALLFVWLGLARATFDSRVAVAVASATVVALGVVIVASERGDISQKYPFTALAAVVGRAPSLDTELSTLWHNPVVEPAAAQVVRFVGSLPGPRTSVTLLVTPNVATEALVRLGRANAVGSSNPCQESLSQRGPERAAQEVRALRPGGVVVISESTQEGGEAPPIEHYTFALMAARFTLKKIAADGRGLVGFRMTLPGPAAPGPVATPPTGPTAIGCA